jgi:hypothetical protein
VLNTNVLCVCAWCKKLRLNGMWVQVNHVTGVISHGICPNCALLLRKQIQIEVTNGV